MAIKYVKNARECDKGTDGARIHKSTQGHNVQEDGGKIKEKHGMKPHPRPTHKHAHALCIGDDNEKLHKVWQVCCEKKKKQKQRRLPRPLYRENARQSGMLSKTLRERKRKHKVQHAKTTNQPPKGLHTLSLYRGTKARSGKWRGMYIRITHTTHFCYTSTGPLLCFSSSAFGHADRRRQPTKV